MTHTQKIIVDRRVIVAANNSNFPKLSENVAVRLMLQDIDKAAKFYSPTISKDAMKSC